MSKTNKTEETKATTETTATTATTSKKGTWLNRLFSAVIGAAVAVGAMFGITNEKIAEEKTKVETIQTQAKEALDAIKNGDIKTATAKLTEATAVAKEVANDVKEVANQVKTTDKKDVGETIINAIKDEFKGTSEVNATAESGITATPVAPATK